MSEEKKASEVGHVEQNLPEKLNRYFLLPGDPNRVNVMASQWDPGVEIYELARRERAAHPSGRHVGSLCYERIPRGGGLESHGRAGRGL